MVSTPGRGFQPQWLVYPADRRPKHDAHANGLTLALTGKFFGVLLSTLVLGWMVKTQLKEDETRDFLWESWKFVKQIFPLLIVGVFAVGIIRELIKPEWIQALAGQNTVLGNFVGVVFGVFMYFPTLVEVPIAQMFLSLGMHRGPAACIPYL
jgi:uncharacterized protein